jgi:glycine/D-amino acid oxidase-like deaminating enzyme
MVDSLEVDVLVFGSGIAGLWITRRLLDAGYACLLVETAEIGGVQTLASQGIIHGGTKYALIGKLTGSSEAIRKMPSIWRACLSGKGELDLSGIRILSDYQYLWTTGGLVSKAVSFVAGKVMHSRVTPVAGDSRPRVFHSNRFKGELYRLDEPVLDTADLVQTLAKGVADCCMQIAGAEVVRFDPEGAVFLTRSDGRMVKVHCRKKIFSAGAGNERLLQLCGRNSPAMQRRSLQMTMLRGNLPPLFGHCIGKGANPGATITSYPLADNLRVWYLGGDVAEQGVGRDRIEQIKQAKAELTGILPWMDFTKIEWAVLNVDRAEPKTHGGGRPDTFFVDNVADVITVWPTKLAFAPKTAQVTLEQVQADLGRSKYHPLKLKASLTMAPLPWERDIQWS